MLRVGLTGGIACGKSVVRELLARHGAFTVDADAIVHRLLGAGSDLAHRIGEEFGEDVLAADGSVDRGKLGRIVFADAEARGKLNRLVHPRVIAEAKKLLAQAEAKGERIGVVDAALMIETGSYRDYDFVVVVYCPRALQLERLRERGFSREEAQRRIDAQMAAEDKKQFADWVIDTSGTLGETAKQVDELWTRLLARAG